jgi:chromosome segregation ATPase
LRETTAEIAGAARRIAELEQLCNAADAAAQREAQRAETAEAADRAARELVADRDAAIVALRARTAEQAGVAAETALALEREIAAVSAVVAVRDQEIARLGGLLAAERERIEELTRSGEAQSSYAATQQTLVESLRRDLDERVRDAAALTDGIESARQELRDARTRAAELQDALTPFAEMAESYDLADAAWVVDSGWCEDRKHRIVVADFRAARSAALGTATGIGSPLAPDLLGEKDAVAPRGEVREETPT